MVGTLGVALSVVCTIGVVVNGRTVAPEGDLFAAATFCFGVGVYALSVALLLPLAEYSPPARRRWRRAAYLFLVYGLVLEPMQAFRGLDPRFTEEGNAFDSVAGIVFGAAAGLTTVLFVLLGGSSAPMCWASGPCCGSASAMASPRSGSRSPWVS
jgi:hypothetical protein